MNENRTPLFLGVLALTAILLPTRVAKSPDATSGDAPPEESRSGSTSVGGAPGEEKSAGKETSHPASWREPIRLYQDFFGIPVKRVETAKLSVVAKLSRGSTEEREYTLSGTQPMARDEDLTQAFMDIKQHAQGYELEFMIALVPDPLDSNLAESFDQALDAVQTGYSESGYLLDSLWLPWLGAAAERKAYRDTPGLLLFRDAKTSRNRLIGVFLVGETPKRGIQKAAFLASLQIAKGLREDLSQVRILGPFFSGSAESLALALTSRTSSAGRQDVRRGLNFRVVTGSATAPGLEGKLAPPIQFERTVIPDDIVRRKALAFLTGKLGWDRSKIGLLAEFDTVYGRGYLDSMSSRSFLSTFPSGVSDIRTAWEKNGKFARPEEDDAPIKLRKLTLDLSLADPTKPIDIIPEFSALSVRSHDLQISNLLTSISHDEIRYLGILATDVRDTLFLAKRIRQYAPDVILFTFDNHILHAHPQFGGDTDGMLVISNFPLVTEGSSWQGLLGGPQYKSFRRQFTSDFQEGIYRATLKLLHPEGPVPGDTRGWIAAVGNGALWPITDLPVSATELKAAAVPSFPLSDPRASIQFAPSSPKSALQHTLLLLSLLPLSWWLYRTLPPASRDPETTSLLVLGYAVLALAAEIIILTGTLPAWHAWRLGGPSLAVLVVFCTAPLSITRPSRLSFPRVTPEILTAFSALLLLPALAWVLRWLWMPGPEGAKYFALRARLASGLSPLLPLICLGGALYVWVLLELKRRRIVSQHLSQWPLEEICGAITDSSAPIDQMLTRLGRTVPPRGSRSWWILGLTLLPPTIFLALTLQPVCETRQYGWIFLGLVVLCLGLSALSFFQFVRFWLIVDALVLKVLEHSYLMSSFRRISGEVGWEPMRSFGAHMPNFKMLTLAVEKLCTIYHRFKFKELSREEEIQKAVEKLMAAHRAEDFKGGIQARQELHDIFASICKEMASHRHHSDVKDFFAVSIVACLRPVVAQMRNFLMASLLAGFLVLLAVRTYAFEPKQFISVLIWSALILAVVVTLWVLVQMDRSPTLSAISGTPPGKVTFDRNFFLNISMYGLVPLLGVVAAQFPQLGQFVGTWFNPLLRVVGPR